MRVKITVRKLFKWEVQQRIQMNNLLKNKKKKSDCTQYFQRMKELGFKKTIISLADHDFISS